MKVRIDYIVTFTCIWFYVATSLPAQNFYLQPGHPDGIALLGPPPLPGSAEAAADLLSVQSVFKARTPAEKARADGDAILSFKLFASVVGPVFDLDKLTNTDRLLKNVRHDIPDVINIPKNHWKRLRPYQMDPKLTSGQPESSASYPSGNSAAGMTYALVLAELFPEKSEAILAIGRDVGWDRVLLGKHFPTDIRAGRVLAYAIVRELDASPAFQTDLATAKAEITAARSGLKELAPAELVK